MTNTPCTWYGVTCSGGHVTGLDLSSNSLYGSLPAALDNLGSLQSLRVASNFLTEIPSQLGSLTNLVTLRLENNALIGEIPSTLASLTNLADTDVGYNAMTASDPIFLPNQARNSSAT